MQASIALRASGAWAIAILLLGLLTKSGAALAEDGHELWLRYRGVGGTTLDAYRRAATELVGNTDSPILRAAADELQRALAGLLAVDLPAASSPIRDGAIIFGTPRSSSIVAGWKLD